MREKLVKDFFVEKKTTCCEVYTRFLSKDGAYSSTEGTLKASLDKKFNEDLRKKITRQSMTPSFH